MKQTTITNRKANTIALICLGILTLVATASCKHKPSKGAGRCPATQTVYLRADVTTVKMLDGRVVPMWGYALDSSFGKKDGLVMVPGPEIDLCEKTVTLNVQLDNNLPEPTSVVINGQQGDMTPVRNPDGRVRSFTHETPPGNTTPGTYTFTNLRPGTFLYQTGSHPAVQVQMGLTGVLTKLYAKNYAYPNIQSSNQLTVVYNEVDPNLHDAVAGGNFGPGKTVTSTIEFHPRYLMLNGTPVANDGVTMPTGSPGAPILIRFANAGIASHTPVLNGFYLNLVAEDGNLYPYPKTHYSFLLPAGKTLDAVMTSPPGANVSFITDRLLTHM